MEKDAVPGYDVKAIQLYHPAGKKEIRLVYRVFLKEKHGLSTRHQKSFSMTKFGENMAWTKAQEAFTYIEQTGKLPPDIELPASALSPAATIRKAKGRVKTSTRSSPPSKVDESPKLSKMPDIKSEKTREVTDRTKISNSPIATPPSVYSKAVRLIQATGKEERNLLISYPDTQRNSIYPMFLASSAAFNRDVRGCRDFLTNPLIDLTDPLYGGLAGQPNDLLFAPENIDTWAKAVVLAGSDIAHNGIGNLNGTYNCLGRLRNNYSYGYQHQENPLVSNLNNGGQSQQQHNLLDTRSTLNNINVPLNNMSIPLNNMSIPLNNMSIPLNNMSISPNNMSISPNNMSISPNNMSISPNNMNMPLNNMNMPLNNMNMPLNTMSLHNINMPLNSMKKSLNNINLNAYASQLPEQEYMERLNMANNDYSI